MGFGDFSFDLPVLDPSQFSLTGNFQAPTLDPGNFNLNFDPGLSLTGGGGSGGFNWGGVLSNLGVGADILKSGVGTGLNIMSAVNNAKYQKQLQDYYKNQQQRQSAYDAAYMKYLQDSEAYRQQVLAMQQDAFGQFQGQLGDFQSTMSGIVQQELDAAKPLLAQSQQLIEPAIQALAKGEVPEVFAPVLEQAKVRARAALLQQYANSGIDTGTAEAAITTQVDQAVQQQLITAATAMLTGGQGLGAQGLQALSGAGATAAASLQPFLAELQALMSSLGGLTGGAPPVVTSPPPPATVA